MQETRSTGPPQGILANDRAVLIGAVCWTVSVIFFIGQAIVQATATRPYDMAKSFISDLGNTSCGPALCIPLHSLMNATFIVTGLLHWAGAITIQHAWPAGRLRTTASVLLCLAGWGLAYAGVFPENVAPTQHAIGALIGLSALNAGMIVLGSALLSKRRTLGSLPLGAGILGGLSFLLFLNSVELLPRGVIERLADYPGAATIVVLGAIVLIRRLRVSD